MRIKAAVSGVVCVAILAWIMVDHLRESHRNVCEVTNTSEQRIKTAMIAVCESTHQLSDLEPGETARFDFEVNFDASFLVDVEFADGTKLSTDVGYVTGGAGSHGNRASITIDANSVEIEQEFRSY